MERNKSVIERQNDMEALSLLRASYRCDKKERTIKYIMIALSFGICILAIFNRYLCNILGAQPETEFYDKLVAIRDNITIGINLASGVIIVTNILLGFYSGRMHTEATVLRDRYDSYIFNNKPNASILRPISNTFVDEYSRKVKTPNEKFKYYVFPADKELDDATAQFEYIREEVHSDYKLYLYVKPFFITVWVGFCLLVIISACIVNGSFVEMLINILIPSLSAITTICSSWHNNTLQMRQLTNLINIVDEIQHLPVEKRWQYVTNKYNMRILADGLFTYHSSAFVIPNFLISMYKRSLKRAEKKNPAQTVDNKYINAPKKKKTASGRTAASATAPTATATTETRRTAKPVAPAEPLQTAAPRTRKSVDETAEKQVVKRSGTKKSAK